ncbi:hypothetical protein AXG93_4805s1110 [Marchantia polymorpha subsp. ruderalis]|uniref:Uncharacterized protein n=1 Tax=Marchantia polymorpha subsp. ruderalis TaxID=1480154 RepID=A0A176VJ88_MARPO|nr:hypothetical protein AXG93_4805s1110 [Marchantia polymorpha subsp. ruderalis]
METIVGSRDREENGTGNSHHLLFIPMIMQAHFAPAIRLAEKLSARGLKIIIVTISKHAESLNKIYTPEGLLKLGLSVEVVEDPKIDPKLPGAWSPLNVAKCMEESCRPLQQRLLGKKKAGSPYPTCMLADKFFTWSKEYAEQLDIPRNESYVSNTDDSHAECMEWLEKQPTKSVLYVCLGSQVVLEKEQIGHFARALDASQQTFLWVLSKRRGNFSILDDVLPEGFLTRTCGRGLVVTGWVGQLQVLAHPSVVGFVSHCGWQSVLESMTFGVPIIGWPHGAEQHFNCRYVQQVLKAGIGIRDVDNRALIVDQLEFENAFKLFSREKLGKALAFNAASFARKAAAAVSRGGSSNEAIDELIESIKQPREIHEN